MTYTEVTVVVEGALESIDTFPDTQAGRLAQATFLGDLERDAKAGRFRAEVFLLEHPHDLTAEECECAQYATDHRPVHVFGREEEL